MKSVTRIKENRLFHRAYKRGQSLVGPYVVVYVVKNRLPLTRLGITAGKKIGNAVLRNRAKRVIRAAFSQCLPMISPGYDIVIVARSRILTVKSTVVADSLLKLFKVSGIIGDGENHA